MAPNVSPARPQRIPSTPRLSHAGLQPRSSLHRHLKAEECSQAQGKRLPGAAARRDGPCRGPSTHQDLGGQGGGRSCHQQPHGCSAYSVAAGGSAPHADPCSNMGAAPMGARGSPVQPELRCWGAGGGGQPPVPSTPCAALRTAGLAPPAACGAAWAQPQHPPLSPAGARRVPPHGGARGLRWEQLGTDGGGGTGHSASLRQERGMDGQRAWERSREAQQWRRGGENRRHPNQGGSGAPGCRKGQAGALTQLWLLHPGRSAGQHNRCPLCAPRWPNPPPAALERGACTPQGIVPGLSGSHPRAGPTHGAGGVLCSTSPAPRHGDAAWAARGGSGSGPATPGTNRGAACPPRQGWLFICSQSCLHQPLAPITRRPRPRLRPRHGPGSPGAAGAVLGTREEGDGTGCVREPCEG